MLRGLIMTVKEMIKELQACESWDAEVYVYIDEQPFPIANIDDGFKDNTRVDINLIG